MRVVVIGGGIVGLTAAFRLRQRGADVLLLEAGSRPGGHAVTVHEDGFLVEGGPNGFLRRAHEEGPGAAALIGDVGLGEALLEAPPAARRRFVVRGGRLRRVPDSPPALVTSDALSPLGKLRVLLEPFARRPRAEGEESVFEFASRRVGREAAEVLVDTAVAGISAGDSRELSVAAAFPLMAQMEREHGSLIRAMLARRPQPPRLVSLAGGMGTLTDALAARLGGALRTGARVHRLAREGASWRVVLEAGESLEADRVVLAVPASQAAPLLIDVDAGLACDLAGFPYAGLAVVALAFRAASVPVPLDGYGYLVPRDEGLPTLGVVWESSLFAGRAPAGQLLVRAMLGGARHPGVVALDEDELVRRARRDLARVLGVQDPPLRTWVWRWPQAIAQYTRGHLVRVARARARVARLPGLELCGTSYDGIAFASGVASAERAVERLLAADGVAEPAVPEPCTAVETGAEGMVPEAIA
jgi:protoporphyrinogen/coproporphyrinogen III oxidase